MRHLHGRERLARPRPCAYEDWLRRVGALCTARRRRHQPVAERSHAGHLADARASLVETAPHIHGDAHGEHLIFGAQPGARDGVFDDAALGLEMRTEAVARGAEGLEGVETLAAVVERIQVDFHSALRQPTREFDRVEREPLGIVRGDGGIDECPVGQRHEQPLARLVRSSREREMHAHSRALDGGSAGEPRE